MRRVFCAAGDRAGGASSGNVVSMNAWITRLRDDLPDHAVVVSALAEAVRANDLWRSLLVGCSLGSERGDEWSDIDAGLTYRAPLEPNELEAAGVNLVSQAGTVVDVLVHRLDGMNDSGRRFAVEYSTGIQLDLAVVPAPWVRSRWRDIPIVDKDGDLEQVVEAPAELRQARSLGLIREWVMLGWWAVSDAAKYLQRESLFEAAARVESVRDLALRVHAVAYEIPDPEYGLTSLLDYPPFELPAGLADTYRQPDNRASVVNAARAAAALLESATEQAAQRTATDLSTPWASTARRRIENVSHESPRRSPA